MGLRDIGRDIDKQDEKETPMKGKRSWETTAGTAPGRIRAGKAPAKETPASIDNALTAILGILVVASLLLVIYIIITPHEGEHFTEFYILGPGKKAYDYPTNLSTGQEGTVYIGIVNREYATTTYTLKTVLGNETLYSNDLTLTHNQTYQKEYTFRPAREGKQKLEFLLYRQGNQTPYRTLHLWIDVKGDTQTIDNEGATQTVGPQVGLD